MCECVLTGCFHTQSSNFGHLNFLCERPSRCPNKQDPCTLYSSGCNSLCLDSTVFPALGGAWLFLPGPLGLEIARKESHKHKCVWDFLEVTFNPIIPQSLGKKNICSCFLVKEKLCPIAF